MSSSVHDRVEVAKGTAENRVLNHADCFVVPLDVEVSQGRASAQDMSRRIMR